FGLNLPRIITFHSVFIRALLLTAAFGFFPFLGRTFAVRANQESSRFQGFLQQIRTAAFRTRFRNRLVRRRELALRIIGAAVEEISASCLLLGQVAGLAIGTLYPNVIL